MNRLTTLYNQLSPTEPINLQHLYDACGNGQQLLVAYDVRRPLSVWSAAIIIGVASLVPIYTPRGVTGRIEDVVVDEKCRGQGIGYQLTKRLLEQAKTMGMKTVHLTSNPKRKKANKLYNEMGFEQHGTNNYRFHIKEA
jgi:GNAT superfamily N-acetyltransferase